jgi:hypothetical protein
LQGRYASPDASAIDLFPFRFFDYRMSRSRIIPSRLSPDHKIEIQPMCGKFTQMMSWTRFHDLAGLLGA